MKDKPQLRYTERMPEPFTRDRIIEALESMPPGATLDDAIERLLFLAKIENGLAELDRSESVPHDEARRRFGQPVAGNLPFQGAASAADEEKELVASGAMKLPEKRPHWDSFFSLPKGNVARKAARRALIESRGDR